MLVWYIATGAACVRICQMYSLMNADKGNTCLQAPHSVGPFWWPLHTGFSRTAYSSDRNVGESAFITHIFRGGKSCSRFIVERWIGEGRECLEGGREREIGKEKPEKEEEKKK